MDQSLEKKARVRRMVLVKAAKDREIGLQTKSVDFAKAKTGRFPPVEDVIQRLSQVNFASVSSTR